MFWVSRPCDYTQSKVVGMDPLSITSTVLSLTAQCLSTAKALYDLIERFKDAELTITAIHSESLVIAASLSQIQAVVLGSPQSLGPDRPELESLFDNALTGCMVVYSALDKEIQDLKMKPDTIMERAAILWKEDTMRNLLQQIRWQKGSISVLIQTLQMYRSTTECQSTETNG